MTPRATRIGREIADEGERAAAIHGEPADRTGLQWLAILAEEFGEAAMEVTRGEVPPVFLDRDSYRAQLRAELVQVASVAARWIAAIDRGDPKRVGVLAEAVALRLAHEGRDDAGTCRFCAVPASTLHEDACIVNAAIEVLHPRWAADRDAMRGRP